MAADEVFDVTPYAEEMTRYLLRHPLSSSLPRKFKIAFEGCASEDHALTAINDLGFRARIRDGERGFHLVAGGGTSTVATSASVLYDFLPAGEIFEVAEAVIRVFHRLGDFKHKQRNRMKFLIRELGWDGWRAEFEKELQAFRDEGGAPFSFPPDHPPVESAPDWPRPVAPSVTECAARAAAAEVRGPGIVPETPRPVVPAVRYDLQWASTNVRRSASPYSLVTVTIPGDLTGAQLPHPGRSASPTATAPCARPCARVSSSAGCARRTCPSSTGAWPLPAWAWPARTRWPTSRAARGRSRAAWP